MDLFRGSFFCLPCMFILPAKFFDKKMNLKLFLITLYIDSSFLPVSSPTFLYVLANEFPTISSIHRFYSYLRVLGAPKPPDFWRLMFAFLLGKCLSMRPLSHIVFVVKFLRNFLWLYYFIFPAALVSPLSSVCFTIIIVYLVGVVAASH